MPQISRMLFQETDVSFTSSLSIEHCLNHITQRLENHLPSGQLWEPALRVDTDPAEEQECNFTLTLVTNVGIGVILLGTLLSSEDGTKVIGNLSTTPPTKFILLLIPILFSALVLLLIVASRDLQCAIIPLFLIGFSVYMYWYTRTTYRQMLIGGLQRTLRYQK